MTKESWDGEALLSAVRYATGVLAAHVEEVNALNVFPVPDGDTGSNMLATMQAAVAEGDQLSESERSVPGVGAAMQLGALMGARGNSGVILSQIFRGMAEVVGTVDRVTGTDLARAFEQGCRAAFAAVAHPVEGTILTVARDVTSAAEPVAKARGNIEQVLAAAVEAAALSVARTPQLLPVLKQAGVVDAGGRGLELLLRGALSFARGEPQIVQPPIQDIALPILDAIEADGFGYETVFLITPNDGTRLDTGAITERLTRLGELVLVAGDERAVKVHIHNDQPDEVIAYGLSLGTLSRIAVENLDRQASGVRDRTHKAAASAVSPTSVGEVSHAGPPVIAVVAGDGLARIFRTLGAHAVVLGGQSANPSAGELAEAVVACAAPEVIVLPNNPNVRMAARQAGDLCPDTHVEVVPTRNAAEGIAAMLALDPSDGAQGVAHKMSTAVSHIQSMQVAVAVRHARIGRRRVRHGDFIVLGPSDGLLAADTDRTAAILTAVRGLKPGYELMTIYRGQGVPQIDAEHLRDALHTELDGVEIELIDGGQPHYDFLISAE